MTRSPRHPLVLLAALAATALLACGGSDDSGDDDTTTTTAPEAGIAVMTRNLYLGADLVPLFEATGETLAATAVATYEQVVDSDIAGRMEAIAGEIAGAQPDLVALQEATLWSAQAPGADEPEVLYDLVELLLAALEAQGEPYTVAATVDGFAGALPVEDVGVVTLQDRDVILVREGSAVTVANPRSGAFEATLTVEVAGIPIEVVRGWTAVDATLDDQTVALVATHLEAFDSATRDAQQEELVEIVDGSDLPTMVLGDLNAAAGGDDAGAYEAMLGAGFADAWSEANGDEPGPTCCYAADLLGGALHTRIDFVLLRGDFEVASAEVVGIEDSSRAGERWASDHAGVVATLTAP